MQTTPSLDLALFLSPSLKGQAERGSVCSLHCCLGLDCSLCPVLERWGKAWPLFHCDAGASGGDFGPHPFVDVTTMTSESDLMWWCAALPFLNYYLPDSCDSVYGDLKVCPLEHHGPYLGANMKSFSDLL